MLDVLKVFFTTSGRGHNARSQNISSNLELLCGGPVW
jgi:hypothetical protein